MKIVRWLGPGLALLVALLGGMPGTAQAQTGGFTWGMPETSVSCGSVSGVVEWWALPEGGSITVAIVNNVDDRLNLDGFVNDDGDAMGAFAFDLDFPSATYEDWTLKVIAFDETGTVIDSWDVDTFDRACVTGSVGGGGTGSDDDAPAPIDARSDATTDVEDGEPVEDPDGEGRVQVP